MLRFVNVVGSRNLWPLKGGLVLYAPYLPFSFKEKIWRPLIRIKAKTAGTPSYGRIVTKVVLLTMWHFFIAIPAIDCLKSLALNSVWVVKKCLSRNPLCLLECNCWWRFAKIHQLWNNFMKTLHLWQITSFCYNKIYDLTIDVFPRQLGQTSSVLTTIWITVLAQVSLTLKTRQRLLSGWIKAT